MYNCLDKEEKLKNMPMIQAYKTLLTFGSGQLNISTAQVVNFSTNQQFRK
jgi:hypothetical protein